MPKIEPKECIDLVINEKLHAVAIDTSTFVRHQFDFLKGLLAQIGIFNGTSLKCVVSDVCYNEMIHHFSDIIEKSKKAICTGLHHAECYWEFNSSAVEHVLSVVRNNEDSRVRAKTILDDVIRILSIEIINCSSGIDVCTLIGDCANGTPPFSGAGKKNEYPDAISLHGLSRWAKDNNLSVRVVSEDTGWAEYCSATESLYCGCSLQDALKAAAAKVQAYEDIVSYVYKAFSNVESSLYDVISQGVTDNLWKIEFECHADSVFQFDCEIEPDTLVSLEIANVDNGSVSCIGTRECSIVLLIDVLLKISVSGDFNFYVWDGVDKENVDMGSCTIKNNTDLLCAEIVVALNGDLSGNPELLEVSDVNVSAGTVTVNFGHVSPFHEWEE